MSEKTAVMRQVNLAGARVFMGTLTHRANLHNALAELADQHHIQTATFELLGGLHEVEFTAYDFEQQKRLAPLVFTRPMEIVSGHGTISLLENKHHIHTHLTVSFRDENAPHGIVVVGGHAARAVAFAVEFTLTTYEGAPIHRGLHEGTGLMLWDIDNAGK